jgi:mannitol/fructose-specific phosphotransferase system IIA component
MTALVGIDQRRAALKLANATRLEVAGFKRDIDGLPRHEAIVKVVDAIARRYDEKLLGAAKIRHLLIGIAGVGDMKARKILQVAQIYNGDKRLRDLTARQRNLLVELLEQQGWRRW